MSAEARALPRGLHGGLRTIDADHMSGFAHQLRRYKRYITDSAPDVQHTLPRRQACTPEEQVGMGRKSACLESEPVELLVGMAEGVFDAGTDSWRVH